MLREKREEAVPPEGESTEAGHRGGAARSSEEGPVMGLERRGCTVWFYPKVNWDTGRNLVSEAKPFRISKQEVYDAYRQVKANKGAAGVDRQSLEDFGRNMADNLYKLWNRMSSGSYFPPPVRRVDIPKASGGTRPLGIPTVADRIAQTVVKNRLEPELEKHFHPDSYGYRPGRGAVEAVGVARERCGRYDWVLDLDISSFFDTIDHDLLLKALKFHTDCRWILLYVERWLKAPVELPDGTLQERERGTPQGGVISPLLANLFLHYAFDCWMQKHYPEVPFERYADDVICHLKTREQAERLKAALEKRFEECGLKLHPEKTRIVYCRDDRRRGDHEQEKFDFLGYTFRPRLSRRKDGKFYVRFSPAVSNKAVKKMNQRIRAWKLHQRSEKTLQELAQLINVVVRGWFNYYGHFYRSALDVVSRQIDLYLAKWAERKYKRLRGHSGRAIKWLRGIKKRQPELFAHWQLYPKNGWTVRAG
jgi:group II intron reverse transcriptase/maturase